MITRQSAKSMIRSGVVVNKDYINSLKKADDVVDAIFDQLEALKHNYEAQEIIIRDKTALIEAMAQPKTCDKCFHCVNVEDNNFQGRVCTATELWDMIDGFYCSLFEPKQFTKDKQ